MRNKLLTAFLLGMILTLMFGYTRNWIESTPTDATVANQIDDFNRNVRVDVAERLETYIGGFNSGDSNAGFYNVLFIEKASTPSTPAAGKGMIYGKAVGGKCELFWIDEDGDEKQITSGGVLKIAAGDFDANSIDEDDIELDNDSWLKAMNNAGDGDVNLIKVGTNDLATLPDSAEMASNAAPTEDEGIANKKYVDDQKTQIVVNTGTVAHGGTIPLPDGYTQAQCSWLVSVGASDWGVIGLQLQLIRCRANANRVVTAQSVTDVGTNSETANYIIIGIK